VIVSMDRFSAPTRADDLQPCSGCGVKLLPEGLDREGRCYGDCSPFDDEEDERKQRDDLPDGKEE